jgi:glucose-6-phosphate 1-dehydrogenase
MVIFGASGDLTKRKLLPALYNLAKDNLLSKEFAVIGFARNELTSQEFRDKLSSEIAEFATTTVDPGLWSWFSERIYYVSGEFGDPAAYARLTAQLEDAPHAWKLFLLSRHCAGVLLAHRQTIGRGRSG